MPNRKKLIFLIFGFIFLLSSCGQSGRLYLPEQTPQGELNDANHQIQ